MKILFNFSFTKAGGGQNVALNFLGSLNICDQKHEFLVCENSLLHKYLVRINNQNFKVVSNNPVKRIIWEFFRGRKFIADKNIQIIYTYFGFSFFPKNIPQVIGAADSNLFYPEIDFWSEFSGFSLLKKKAIDLYRIYGLKNASGIIFENKLLNSRCIDIYNIKAKTTTILPSINLEYEQLIFNLEDLMDFKYSRKGLFLCSWQEHKGILKIPEIACKLKEAGIFFSFILTAPRDFSEMHLKFESLIEKYDVKEFISIIGPVKKRHLKSLYDQIDLVFLISKLESFSNNIIEAWAYEKVLIISDEEWAHGLCGNAACYVARNNVDSISNSIITILDSRESNLEIIKNGKKELKKLPTIEKRTSLELEFIKTVFENKCID